ncbi:MAG: carboxylate--amine ligase [Chloroflexi bacterium]|nr:MAG: carboxylate--amine ligase [Chloroflexota bacterium]
MTQSQHVSTEQLRRLFHPRSIALIGATDNSRWSLYTYQNLKNFGFPGPVYLVNPNRAVVHGEPAYKTLRDLPEVVDLAFVMVPTPGVLPVMREAAGLGTKNVVILTSGFSEMGEEGTRLEREILAIAQGHGLTLLGPNGNGFVNVADQITPYGLLITPPLKSGPVGVVLQSGALVSAVLTYAQGHGIGLSLMVAMGNETMISVTDVVDYLLEEETTRSVALFLESIREPDELRRVAEKARALRKAIVALKIGSSEISSRTAMAHTGALVGDNQVNDAALRQLGIIRVSALEDLLSTAALAGYSDPLPGPRMGVVTPSGGACDLISDLAEEVGLELPAFAPETVERLQAILPDFSTCHNPLDVTGYVVVDTSIQQRSLEVAVNDSHFDFMLYLSATEGRREPTPELLAVTLPEYDNLNRIIREAPRPVLLTSTTCMDLSPTARLVVERTGLHWTPGIEHGMRAIGRFRWWSEFINSKTHTADTAGSERMSYPQPFKGRWSETQARALLEQARIPTVPARLATTAEEAASAACEVGLPVVLKIQSLDLPHKSDVGGVTLNLASEEAVRDEFTAMLSRVRNKRPDTDIEGILVSPMRTAGLELLVGVVRDAVWGPVLTVGLGGIWTEVLGDTAVRVLPIRCQEVIQMLGELRGAPLLRGTRGQEGIDLQAVGEIIYRVGTLALALGPELRTLEINPLLVKGPLVEALDVLVQWQD